VTDAAPIPRGCGPVHDLHLAARPRDALAGVDDDGSGWLYLVVTMGRVFRDVPRPS
jgi:hypothetical protein